ncbi:MAG TPA: hypothetical protein HPP87_13290 [Planctomycetes bacterium]|nr:hypothetical protein [Planctomycetota bacterium]
MDYTVTIVNQSGIHRAKLDNTGTADVSDGINDIIRNFVDDNGLDLYFNPGVYLINNSIEIHRSNISIQGYCYGFRYSPKRLGIKGKTALLLAPSCTDAITLGPASDRKTLHGFTLRNITISGQNLKRDFKIWQARPDIKPPQNGVRVMENTVNGICTIDFCQFVHLTHAIINERPESVMDVWYIVDNWISECNYAIWLDSSLHGSLVLRNGFHDMKETVLHLQAVNNPRYCTHETVISDNTGWNPGKLVFEIDSFRGGSSSYNHILLNKCLPSSGPRIPRQVELSKGSEDNLGLLPTTASTVNSSVARDAGGRNMFCGLPSIKVHPEDGK